MSQEEEKPPINLNRLTSATLKITSNIKPVILEEEKLIEEFESKVLYELPFGDHGSLYATASELICKFWIPRISEAYRSGKLAGFEVCEKLLNEVDCHVGKKSIFGGSCICRECEEAFGYNKAVYDFKSLIEEEKKKL